MRSSTSCFTRTPCSALLAAEGLLVPTDTLLGAGSALDSFAPKYGTDRDAATGDRITISCEWGTE